jgi:hypothetical protein
VVDWRLYVRGVLDPEAPASWVAQGSGVTQLTTANPNVCTDDVTISGITLTDYAWIDVALGLSLHSGESGPLGMLRASFGASYT